MNGSELFPGNCDHGERREVAAKRLQRVYDVCDDGSDEERVRGGPEEYLK